MPKSLARLVLAGSMGAFLGIMDTQAADDQSTFPPTADEQPAPLSESREVHERAVIRDHRMQPGGAFTPSQPSASTPKLIVPGITGPPGGAFTHRVQVGYPAQGPCAVSGIIDVDQEVAESNEGNNVIAFTCP